jgi:hypothetical protein
MIKVGDKVKGFIFESKSTEGEVGYGLNYHPNMDIYVGVEGEVAQVQEETFVVKFKNLRNLSDYDMWTYPIADYIEITRHERLNELGI